MKKFAKKSTQSGRFEIQGISAISEYIKAGSAIEALKITDGDWKLLEAKAGQQKISGIAKEFKKSGPAEATCSHRTVDWKVCLEEIKSEQEERSTILALDGVTDPRNMGAIIRSAGFFGIKRIIVKKRNQSLLTQAAVDTAQGGFAWVQLVVVSNLSHAIKDLKKNDYWIMSTDVNGSQNIATVAAEYAKKLVILGAEQTGVSRLVSESADLVLTIPRVGQIESLNVSVAAGILGFICSTDQNKSK